MSAQRTSRAGSDRPDRLRQWSTLVFAGVAVALLLTAGLGLAMGQLEKAVLSYVKGESLWTGGQKQAVIALESYARTGEPATWKRYREALQIPLGARQAREALQSDPPELDRARRGFLQVGLQPGEATGMIRLFRWLGDWGPMARSIELWTEADSLVGELQREGRRIRSQWQTPPPDTTALNRTLTRVAALNEDITERRRQFTEAVDQASDIARGWGQGAIVGLTVLLLITAGGVIWKLYHLVREREDRFRQMAESIDEVFWLRPADGGEMLYVSPAYEEIWDRPTEDLYQRPESWLESIHPEDRDRVRTAALEGPDPSFETEYRVTRPDGQVRWIHDRGFPVEGSDADPRRVAGVARDITGRKRLEERLRHKSLHDPLTGLANRSLLQDRVEHGLARSRRSGAPLGLLMLDVDDFKRINDQLGHTAGDWVLTELARRLEEAVREEDTVARWGGDEFVIVLPELAEPEAVKTAWERIRAATRPPIEIDGDPVHVGLSVGAVVDGDEDHRQAVHGRDPEELIRFASLALHRAKRDTPGKFSLYDATETGEGRDSIRREDELRGALDRGLIVPHYQAIVRLSDRALVSVEALARWQRSEGGLLGPAEFIPLAEELGLIDTLQWAIVRQGCRDLSAWTGESRTDSPIAIRFNVSGQQFRNRDLVDDLEQVVEEAGARSEQVIVEVTETSLMQVPARVDALREAGFQVSIDDFGTGYSSLTYLRELDVDELKIDMTFVQGIAESPVDAALVDTMLTLGDQLGLRVVAEGIETEEQLLKLRSLGCTFGQGYLFGRPGPLDELSSRGPGSDDGRG